MGKWEYEVKKIYKTPGRAAVQVRFSDGDIFFYKTFACDNVGQLESVEQMCNDEISRVTELYMKVDELNRK